MQRMTNRNVVDPASINNTIDSMQPSRGSERLCDSISFRQSTPNCLLAGGNTHDCFFAFKEQSSAINSFQRRKLDEKRSFQWRWKLLLAVLLMRHQASRPEKAIDSTRQAPTASCRASNAVAGNSDVGTCLASPAGADAPIAVGATDANYRRASFGNKSMCVEIFPPGVGITSA